MSTPYTNIQVEAIQIDSDAQTEKENTFALFVNSALEFLEKQGSF